MKQTAEGNSKESTAKQIEILRAELRAYVDDKHKIMLKVMRQESEAKINETIYK